PIGRSKQGFLRRLRRPGSLQSWPASGRSRMRADLQPVAGNVRSQGAAVVLDLSRYRHGQPGNAVLYPQIIRSLGSNMNVGWLTMIPYVCGGIAMAGWGLLFDRMNEQRWHLL